MSEVPTYTVLVPGKFADWFEGTSLAQGQDDRDADCKELRLAWESAEIRKYRSGNSHRVTGTETALRLLREYTDYCLAANEDERDPAEVQAARIVAERVDVALKK